MVGLGYQDRFLIENALVCMVTHWIRPSVSHDLRLSSSYNLTKLFYFIVSTLRKYWAYDEDSSGFDLRVRL